MFNSASSLGGRTGSYRPQHLSQVQAASAGMGVAADTPIALSMAGPMVRPAGIAGPPQHKQLLQSIIESASEVAATQSSFAQQQAGRYSLLYVLQHVGDSLAQFVEAQVEMALSPKTSTAELQSVLERCRAGAQKMNDLVHACSAEHAQALEAKFSQAIHLENKTPEQAAAAIAMDSVIGVLDQADIELSVAAIGKAAKEIAAVIRLADQIDPSASARTQNTIRAQLATSTEGQAVMSFLDGIKDGFKEGTADAANVSEGQAAEEISIPDSVGIDALILSEPSSPTLQEAFARMADEGAETSFLMELETETNWNSLDDFMSELSPNLEVEEFGGLTPRASASVQRQQILESIGQSVFEVQSAERLVLENRGASSGFSQALKQFASDAAQFVRTQASSAEDALQSLAEIQQVQRRCHAGKEAVIALADACNPLNATDIRQKVSFAVTAENRSPAQAAANVAAKAVERVLAYPDLTEVTAASVAAAAVNVMLATQSAILLRPAERQQVKDEIRSTLRQSEQGQMVSALIAGIRAATAANTPA